MEYWRVSSVGILVCLLLAVNAVPGEQEGSRWWQKEIPEAPSGMTVNPAYLAKKQELEIAWTQLERDEAALKHFADLGQASKALTDAVSSSVNTVNRLEHELKETPRFVVSAADVAGTRPATSDTVQRPSTVPDTALERRASVCIEVFDFPYGVPGEIYSQARMGDIVYYQVRIMPEAYVHRAVEQEISREKFAESMGPNFSAADMHVLPSSQEKSIAANARGAKVLLDPRSASVIADTLRQGWRVDVKVPRQATPPFVQVPVPPGVYYLEYSLVFSKAGKVHPNYRAMSRKNDVSMWGPGRVAVTDGQTSRVLYQPTSSTCAWWNPKYDYDEAAWFGSAVMREYLIYLTWKGTYVGETAAEPEKIITPIE